MNTPVKRKRVVASVSPYFSPSKKHKTSCLLDDDLDTLLAQVTQLKPILVQERLAHDPWRVLVAVTLLNKTAGALALPVLDLLLERWPSPLALSQASPVELADMLRRLGTYNRRALRLIEMSTIYLRDPPSPVDLRTSRCSNYPPTPISHLPGAGKYALDSYRIFCVSGAEWKSVMADDKELVKFLKWKWASTENLQWAPKLATMGHVDSHYLLALISELSSSHSATTRAQASKLT